MAPIPPNTKTPRIVAYYQTHHDQGGSPISVLPLVLRPGISVTHLILAAIHINEDPSGLTLNDHIPGHERNGTLWSEMATLQAAGVKVMGMLGGAAKGTYSRLDGSDSQFERYYLPLRDMVRQRGLDGLDLDVEEEMSLSGIIRLIDRLRADFGGNFILTMAPVAAALLNPQANLSGFDYVALEVMRGREIAWYNTQFYCGWGDCTSPSMYHAMVRSGWPADKLVVGLVTNPENGSGFVPMVPVSTVFAELRMYYPNFGGVMGWEYFNALPGGRERPWEWAETMTGLLRSHLPESKRPAAAHIADVETGALPDAKALPVPTQFDYYSDGTEEE
ncbi:Glycosyl hydrolases family 18 [Geosmithia morbida]|uniref:chitinase n=1 Tax=Geosmithia morbida TaxID=1094350 RepID=A0A9P5D1S1_9HYPO|nr:Glycosyl hydrolases family 18 [Geosmithia morbida]KAF4120766.1 Glycosyl hydrolases family 18 [Geosmithia morbida]